MRPLHAGRRWPIQRHCKPLAARADVSLQALDGSCRWFLQVVALWICNCTLQLKIHHVPPGSPTIKGSESGEGHESASGSKRCLPRLLDLLMYSREERHWGRMRLWSELHTQELIFQLWVLRARPGVPLIPNACVGLGKHGRQPWIWLYLS